MCMKKYTFAITVEDCDPDTFKSSGVCNPQLTW